MNHDVTIYKSLPAELVVHVLEFAAGSSTHSALVLCYVSSWTRSLAVPHLLSSVILRNFLNLRRFCEAVVREPYHFRFQPIVRASMVHRLMLPTYIEPYTLNMLAETFLACENLRELVTDDQILGQLLYKTSGEHVHTISPPRCDFQIVLRDLPQWGARDEIADTFDDFPPEQRSPIFTMTTHMRLPGRGFHFHQCLRMFPNVSHISIPVEKYNAGINTPQIWESLSVYVKNRHTNVQQCVITFGRGCDRGDAEIMLSNLDEARRNGARFLYAFFEENSAEDQWAAEVTKNENLWEMSYLHTREWEQRGRKLAWWRYT